MLNENGRTLAGVISEMKDELKEFLQTRYDMLVSELKGKLTAWKIAIPLIAAAVVLIGTAWLVFTAALVSVLAAAFFPNRYAYFFSLLIVGIAYALSGAICAVFAVRGIKEEGVAPVRTLHVLKQDQIWLQQEARTR